MANRLNAPLHPDTSSLSRPQTSSSTPSKRHHYHVFRWLLLILIVLGLSVGGYWGWTRYQATYYSLPAANTATNLIEVNQTYQKSNKFTYEFYWKPGCPDCEHIQKAGIIPALHRAQRQANLVAVNTTKFKTSRQAQDWFANSNFGSVPTLIIKYHGYPIYLYTGTNTAKFKKLLNGINPETGRKLKHAKPQHETIDNDFDHSLQNIDSNNPVTGQ